MLQMMLGTDCIGGSAEDMISLSSEVNWRLTKGWDRVGNFM